MTTLIRFDEIRENETVFKVYNGPWIYVTSFENGIVEVQASCGETIDRFAKIISGCFAPMSNFEKVIVKAFNASPDTKVKGIKVVFNDIHVCTATREEHDAKSIVSKYYEQMK